MKIGVDVRGLHLARTGVKTYLEEICSAFSAIGNHEVLLLTPALKPANSKSSLGKIAEHLKFYYWKEVQLPYLAWRNDCDIIFCVDYVVPLLTIRSKAVPVFHDAFFWEYPQHYNKYWRVLLNLLGVPAAKKAPVVITTSLYAKQTIAAHTGIDPGKIVPVYEAPKSSTTVTIPESVKKDTLQHYHIGRNPFILHVGVLEKRKNLVNLIKAFRLALPHLPQGYQLVLVGQPGPKQDLDDSTAIRELIADSELAQRVLLTGYVPDDHLTAFYQAAAVYAFPSINEGFGLPVLEAFASNLPLVASNVTAIPEIAADAALLFDPYDPQSIADALVRVANDDLLRQEMIAKGQLRLQQFTWEKTARHLIAIFEKICANP
jgi:glycosyltransferase involved in cell wall biosynthesis